MRKLEFEFELPDSAMRTVVFAAFEADLQARELRRHGKRVRLPDQSFQILTMLLEHPGELVTREALRAKLWPGDTFVDFDHGMNNAVNRLREALGDSPESPKFIETLPRRGYRFIAPANGHAAPLADTRSSPASQLPSLGEPAKDFSPRGSRWLWALSLIVLLPAGFFLAHFYLKNPSLPSSRSFVLPPDGARFQLSRDSGGPPALSPDGTELAFVAMNAKGLSKIWVRPLASLTAQPLERTEGASFPFWSPDGRWLGFFSDADGKLKKIRVSGGPPVTICDARAGRGGAWNQQGIILFSPSPFDALFQVSEMGGVPKPVTHVDSSVHTSHRWPRFLPNRRQFLFLAVNHGHDSTHDGIYLGSLDEKGSKRIIATHADAVYAAGYLFYLLDDALVAQAFDPSAGEFRGGPRPTIEKVVYDPSIWKAVFDVSERGVMAYQLGGWMAGSQLSWLDRSGKTTGHVGEAGFYSGPFLSPDGRKLVAGKVARFGHFSDLWVYDLTRAVGTRITAEDEDIAHGIWSRDSSKVLFRAKGQSHSAVYEMNADGTGKKKRVFEGPFELTLVDLSPDGRFLLASAGESDPRKSRLWTVSTQHAEHAFPLLEDGTQLIGSFSPDGRWVAFASYDSGREEVYVVPFSDHAESGPPDKNRSTSRLQISSSGGKCPRWRADGKELFYVSADNMLMSVAVDPRGRAFRAAAAHALFRAFPSDTFSATSEFLYDVAADGSRFIFDPGPAPESNAPITLVQNWLSDLEK